MPVGGELDAAARRSAAWRRRRRRASARRRSARAAGRSSHLANSTFCWLPPESVVDRRARCRRARTSSRALSVVDGRRARRAALTHADRARPRRGRAGSSVLADRAEHQQALLLAALRAASRCPGATACARRCAARTGAAVEHDRRRRRAGRRRRSRARPRCARCRRGRPGRRSRRRARRSDDVADSRRPRSGRATASTTGASAGGAAWAGTSASSERPSIAVHERLAASRSRRRRGADQAPVAHAP